MGSFPKAYFKASKLQLGNIPLQTWCVKWWWVCQGSPQMLSDSGCAIKDNWRVPLCISN
jgi:hypothetical protein